MFDESPVEVLKVDSEELKANTGMKPGTERKPMTWKMNAVRTATCGWFLVEQRNILFSHTISDGPVVERTSWIFLKAIKEM